MSRPDFTAIAEDLVKQCREVRLGLDQKRHEEDSDYSKLDCMLVVRRALESAFDHGECRGVERADAEHEGRIA